jgi:type III pantothenate kinase
MANLVIDIGNTFTKIAVFEDDNLVSVTKVEQLKEENIIAIIQRYSIKKLIYTSVKQDFDFHLAIPVLKFSHQTKIPIANLYQSPETLGLDRLAAVIGASHLYNQTDILVIDAGTCITYDFINKQKQYKGGSISPGLQMRFKAMHEFTGKLPLVTLDENNVAFYGASTHEALQSGVVNGLIFEVTGYINHYLNHHPETKIILCGGDATFFDTKLKNSIFAHQILTEPHLVLIGLNKVVNYQHD